MVKVAKFGGSSCASSEQFKKVKDIVLSDRDRKYIVVSAPGKRNSKDTKVTDLFLSLYEAVQEKKDGAEGKKSADGKVGKLLEKIQKRYQEILDGLSLSLSLETEGDYETAAFRSQPGLCGVTGRVSQCEGNGGVPRFSIY